MVTCACHAAATDWSARPSCSIAATKPTVDMPMPPHSSGISMPSRPNPPISRSRSVGQRASSHAIGARAAISFCAKSRHRCTRSCSDSVSEKSTARCYWTDRYDPGGNTWRGSHGPGSTGERHSAVWSRAHRAQVPIKRS